MQNEPTIVTSWDSMPPEVYAEGEIYSTRVLAAKYKEMEEAMTNFVKRVEKGEVRSTVTYSQFKSILGI